MHRRASIEAICKALPFFLLGLLIAACAAPLTGDATAEPTSAITIPIEDLVVYVPAGHFYMGSDQELDPAAQEDELPIHSVLLDGFFIYRNEVSNGLYQQCVAAGVCSAPEIFEDGPSTHYNDPEYKDNPVVGVNWDQASAFCSWAEARLPTEAEWEKTARGESADLYPWGADDPSCSLSNMAGCFIDPPDTNMVGQYPTGESIYEANDMSGNVWEWTLDWYDEDYYAQSPGTSPLGPENGELRVVRGGSYEDGVEALRSAERLPLDPDKAYNNVGFRCVPIGVQESAVTPPFCQPAYVPFCRSQDGDPQCDPTQQTGDTTPTPNGDGYEFVAFGCPDGNGQVPVTIDSEEDLSGQVVTVGGIQYTCVQSTSAPNRWVCQGPHPPEGTITTVEVCPADSAGTGSGLVAFQPSGAAKLSGFQPAGPEQTQLVAYQPVQAAQPALESFQPTQEAPQGLQAFEPQAGGNALVAFQATASNCADGYIYNPTTGQCEQDPNGSCPDGWTLNTETNQCDPGENGCPEGTSPTAGAEGCTPDTGDECPTGYTYVAASNRCEPPSNQDGGGCPAGYYFDPSINCCAPAPGNENGCDPGFYRSASTNQCEPADENGCPAGTVYNPYEGGCVPSTNGDNPTGEGCRDGFVPNDAGQCIPADNNVSRIIGACPEGAYYDENLQQCVTLENGKCGPGYYLNLRSNTCVPTDGPGSGCPAGYAYSSRANCCVPTPGNGSYCPGDEPSEGSLRRTLSTFPQPSGTGYDYGYGYCDPVDGEPCPDGYTYDEQTASCVQTTTAGRILEVGCPEGTYLDEELRYCVPTQCGCEIGYILSRDGQGCVPDTDQPSSDTSCWSYEVSVPVCPYTTPTPAGNCDPDEKYNPLTGECERIPEEEVLTCADYGSQSACQAAGCSWYAFSNPPCF